MKILLELFLVFAKVGLFSFGGGYVMLAMFDQELVKKRKWVTDKDLMDYYAVAVCTPGVIAVNVATFCGHKIGGKTGGIAATLGMITPSIIIVTSVCLLLKGFMHNQYVLWALAGIKIGVAALLLNFVVDMAKKNMQTVYAALIFVICLNLLVFTDVHLIFVILTAGILGYSFGCMRGVSK